MKGSQNLSHLMTRRLRWMTDQIRIQINHARRSPKPVRQALLIIAGIHILSEVPSVLRDCYPKYWTVEIDPYLSPWFHLKVERCWYLKDITEDIEKIGTYYAFGKIALQYSVAAFIGVFIFFCYHCIDGLFYLWNFKQSHLLYYDLLWYAIILHKLAISPSKSDNLAKIKSLF